jgi:hypothetical protein
MKKRAIIPLLALAIAAPFYAAAMVNTGETGNKNETNSGDTTNITTTTVDCGSQPTAPATGATLQERQQYQEQLHQYNQCKRGQFKDQRQNLQNQHQNLQDERQQFTEERCKLVNQRINDRLSNFQNKQNVDSTIFGNVYQRLTNLSIRLKSKGLDTTKLNEDLATLKTKIDKVHTDYVSFIDGLKQTQSSTCGHSQGEFMGKLGAARSILLTVRQDRQDVRNYILNTIKPDIMALRQQLAKQEQADNSETNSTNNTNL